MSDETPKRSNKPVEGAKVERLGFHMRIGFYPEIRLDRKRGYEFAQSLSSFFEPQVAKLETECWFFSQPLGSSPSSHVAVTVECGELQFHATSPESGMELYERTYANLLREFHSFFQPELMLQTSAMVRGLLDIDGDARLFLVNHVMKMADSRADSFGRPIHLVGLRLLFPPYEKKGSKRKAEKTEWSVDVKAESSIQDPGKLFLEADADWRNSIPWNRENERVVVDRLQIVSDYLEKSVIDFLRDNRDEQDPTEHDAPE